MPKIETANWTPPPESTGRRTYAGQRAAQEVFDDLEAHLRSIGYLPEDYFLLDRDWSGGRAFPEGGWLTSRVDYGGSEGIYLDIALEYEKNGKPKCEHFATGKTLDENGFAMDRLFLTASAVTRAFHEDGLHARYAVIGGAPATEGIAISLSPEERRLAADGLALLRDGLAPGHPDYELAGQLFSRIDDGGELEQAFHDEDLDFGMEGMS